MRGWDVGVAADPDDACNEVLRFDWDAAFVDPDPPRPAWTDGLAAIRRLRPSLPIVLATGFARHEAEIAPLAELCQRVMVKPLDAWEIVDVLCALAGRETR